MTKIEVPDDLTECDGKALDVLARQARDLDVAIQVELHRRGSEDREAAKLARYAAIPPNRRAIVQFLEGGKWRMLAMAAGAACLMNARSCADFARGVIERVAAAEDARHQQDGTK